MPDQAQSLRELAVQTRHGQDFARAAVVKRRKTARTIAVTSGKGGVGKTSFSTNIAVLFAKAGQRVIILDADLGLANIHIHLGITPSGTLEHVIRAEKSLRDILIEGSGGLRIIAGASGITEIADLSEERLAQFMDTLSEMDELADVIVIDTGAGVSHNVMAFVQAADEAIVIVTPDPASIADAYATIKILRAENPSSQIRLVVNMAKDLSEARAVANRLRLVSRRFLKADIEVLGYVPRDPGMQAAVLAQQPLCIKSPGSPAALAIAEAAKTLGYDVPRTSGAGSFLNRLARRVRAGA